MPVCQRALGLVGLKLAAQPLVLGGADAHRHFTVQRNHPPGAGGKRVIPETARPREAAEIIVVAGRARSFVLVVAGNGPRAFEMTAPRRIVAIAEIRRGALHVGEIAKREQRARQAVEQRTGLQGAKAAFADIARCENRGRCLGGAATAAATTAPAATAPRTGRRR